VEEGTDDQGSKEEEFALLSEMLGPKGVAFDNDELLDVSDDDDLKNDPVSQIDLQVIDLSLSDEKFCSHPLARVTWLNSSKVLPLKIQPTSIRPQTSSLLRSYSSFVEPFLPEWRTTVTS